MDLGRLLRVAWRFKVLVGAGLTLAVVVSALSVVRVDIRDGSPVVSFREEETWVSAATLLITQDGFPWGRAILDDMIPADGGATSGAEPRLIPRFGDPGRYSGLAALYAELAKGDVVRREAMAGARAGEYYEPMVVQQPGASVALPMIYLKGFGASPDAAVAVAGRATRAFVRYLKSQQVLGGIDPGKRVKVAVTQQATTPELFAKRSFVRPVMLFLLLSLMTLAAAFALENLRPRVPAPAGQLPDDIDDVRALRPAEVEAVGARQAGST